MATVHDHTQFNNHGDPNQPTKREHDPTHLEQQHHSEADYALALDTSLHLQTYLGATTKRMPASTDSNLRRSYTTTRVHGNAAKQVP